jgi:hypothetical protein
VTVGGAHGRLRGTIGRRRERGGNRDQRAGKEKHYACMYSDGERLEFPAAVQVPSTLTLHPLPICALIAGTVHVVPDHKHRKST